MTKPGLFAGIEDDRDNQDMNPILDETLTGFRTKLSMPSSHCIDHSFMVTLLCLQIVDRIEYICYCIGSLIPSHFRSRNFRSRCMKIGGKCTMNQTLYGDNS